MIYDLFHYINNFFNIRISLKKQIKGSMELIIKLRK